MGYNSHQPCVPYDTEQLLADLKKNYRNYIALVSKTDTKADVVRKLSDSVLAVAEQAEAALPKAK